MSLALIFKPAARVELVEAIAWYEGQRPGLGREFALEVRQALERARANPDLFRRVRGKARKIRLSRFPYSIYFAIQEEVFSVLAVFHGARDGSRISLRNMRNDEWRMNAGRISSSFDIRPWQFAYGTGNSSKIF